LSRRQWLQLPQCDFDDDAVQHLVHPGPSQHHAIQLGLFLVECPLHAEGFEHGPERLRARSDVACMCVFITAHTYYGAKFYFVFVPSRTRKLFWELHQGCGGDIEAGGRSLHELACTRTHAHTRGTEGRGLQRLLPLQAANRGSPRRARQSSPSRHTRPLRCARLMDHCLPAVLRAPFSLCAVAAGSRRRHGLCAAAGGGSGRKLRQGPLPEPCALVLEVSPCRREQRRAPCAVLGADVCD